MEKEYAKKMTEIRFVLQAGNNINFAAKMMPVTFE